LTGSFTVIQPGRLRIRRAIEQLAQMELEGLGAGGLLSTGRVPSWPTSAAGSSSTGVALAPPHSPLGGDRRCRRPRLCGRGEPA
jgi:hypothetical protein